MIDCGVVVTRRLSHVNSERLSSAIREWSGPPSAKRLTKLFQLPWVEKLTGECAGDRRGSGKLALTQMMRAPYTSILVGSQELFRLLTYFFLSITICEFPEFMSSQSNASGLNKSIERRRPSITEVLSHYQDITASSMMKHQKGTLLIASDWCGLTT